eukprot:TRINITY_DN12180_c0_g1_i1.p1 TRINITY_DN12180_c0_g1~~TRINITY_DN12180_c0_g1_i1.p1  ORF type:complete len:256 (-),score=39.64 TRINITY_DN12180_c0_g1_i1:50-817(-)
MTAEETIYHKSINEFSALLAEPGPRKEVGPATRLALSAILSVSDLISVCRNKMRSQPEEKEVMEGVITEMESHQGALKEFGINDPKLFGRYYRVKRKRFVGDGIGFTELTKLSEDAIRCIVRIEELAENIQPLPHNASEKILALSALKNSREGICFLAVNNIGLVNKGEWKGDASEEDLLRFKQIFQKHGCPENSASRTVSTPDSASKVGHEDVPSPALPLDSLVSPSTRDGRDGSDDVLALPSTPLSSKTHRHE